MCDGLGENGTIESRSEVVADAGLKTGIGARPIII
jgi:hypothetical protein